MRFQELLAYGLAEKETYKKWVKKAKKSNARALDQQFHTLHEQVFRKVDCLSCANCCKTTSPIFRDIDIKRLSKYLRTSERNFIDSYLKIDEEGDYVLKSSPCPFLDADNYCKVYESRPKACREYPHTDRKKMVQITELTFKNTLVCPAVLEMVERLKKVEL